MKEGLGGKRTQSGMQDPRLAVSARDIDVILERTDLANADFHHRVASSKELPASQQREMSPRFILLHVKTFRREWDQLPDEAKEKWSEITDRIVNSPNPSDSYNFEYFRDKLPDDRFDELCRKVLEAKPHGRR